MFSDTTTVGQVNSLLQSLPAEIAGSNPWGQFLLLRLTGPSDLNRLSSVLQTLRSNPLVSDVSSNYMMTPLD
jgi:hypothetical protein